MELVEYRSSCPVCGGPLTDEEARIYSGVCKRCYPAKPFEELEKAYHEIEKTFEELIGKPWEIQKFWIRHLSAGLSFSLPSPPGTGKTSFGAVACLYYALKGHRSVAMFPTTVILKQFVERLEIFLTNKKLDRSLLLYYISGLTDRNSFWERLERGDFSIIAITTAFFQKNREKFSRCLSKYGYKFAFVDDVDAVLKSSKSLSVIVETASPDTILVVSSATAVPRGRNPRVLLEKFGFYPSGSVVPDRRIQDLYLPSSFNTPEEAADVFKNIRSKLGEGGLIFFERGTPDNFIKEFTELTETTFYRRPLDVEKFINGEIAFLVHKSSIYGSLVRGLDAPLRVRYVVFFGVPNFKIALSEALSSSFLLQFFQMVEVLTKHKHEFHRIREKITTFLNRYSTFLIRSTELPEDVKREGTSLLREIVSDPSLIHTLAMRRGVAVVGEGESSVILFPDAATYLQASGRASRMYGSGITFGVSVVVDDRQELVKALERSLAIRYDIRSSSGNGIFVEFEEANFQDLLKKIEESRRGVSEITSEDRGPGTALMVVESPTKARTISGFFGKAGYRKIGNVTLYQGWASGYSLYVAASKGHVYDLTTLIEDPVSKILKREECYGVKIVCEQGKSRFVGIMEPIVRVSKNGTVQQLAQPEETISSRGEVISNQRDTIEALRLAAWLSGQVFLTTDPDTEGERISYDLESVFSFIPQDRRKRLEMHAITPRELSRALENPRQVNIALVESQLTRRYEDRWIGFSLSQKLQMLFQKSNLSAGRVQTPVLGWIIERTELYHAREKFIEISLGNLIQRFGPLNKKDIFKKVRKAKVTFFIEGLKEERKEIQPLPPLTTSAMLEEASRIFKFPSSKTMQLAQDLFSIGLITYHRTDSTHISEAGFQVAVRYAELLGLQDQLKPRSWGGEGSHEAIRPTRPMDPEDLLLRLKRRTLSFPVTLTPDHLKLYSLIFNRFMASQWKEALVDLVNFNLHMERLKVNSEVIPARDVLQNTEAEISAVKEILEPGFLIWKHSYRGLKRISTAEIVERLRSEGRVEFSQDARVKSFPAAMPFTEGELVNQMKNKGIGRPSTFASIIQKIKDRKFAIAVGKAGYLISTPLGKQVFEFLNSNYGEMVSEDRTRRVEQIMDEVASGEAEFQEYLRDVFENEILKIWGS